MSQKSLVRDRACLERAQQETVSIRLSLNQNSNRRIPVGKEGAKGRAMLSHWIPPGSCPVSLVLRQYPQRRNTTTTLGVFSWLLILELASSVHP